MREIRDDGPWTLQLTVNGTPVQVEARPSQRLLDVLREGLGLTATQEGCGEGECGSCTVLLDGLPVNACLVPAYQAQGRSVVTAESTAPEEVASLLESGATQCGACTSGIVMMTRWLATHPEAARDRDPRELLAGNLCRCTGYAGILRGVTATLRRDVEE